MSRPVRHLLGLALAAAALAGCGTSSDHELRLAMAALQTPPPKSASSPPPTDIKCADPTASLRPPATLPAPGAMPQGTFMHDIQKRGYLIAGVNAGAYRLGYLNPATGKIEGFEIDLVRALARAIFGDSNPNRVRLVALRVAQREDAIRQGRVDIVVDEVTITCKRRQLVDFSTVYYNANQRVLVRSDSPATGIGDFTGRHVCASAQSVPLMILSGLHGPVPYPAPQAIDCFVYLQEGRVPAISTDDAILLGFNAQDRNTKIIGGSLASAPYGMEIDKSHQEFVRFVNGVLAKLRADGTWRSLFDTWLSGLQGSNPVLSPAQYDG